MVSVSAASASSRAQQWIQLLIHVQATNLNMSSSAGPPSHHLHTFENHQDSPISHLVSSRFITNARCSLSAYYENEELVASFIEVHASDERQIRPTITTIISNLNTSCYQLNQALCFWFDSALALWLMAISPCYDRYLFQTNYFPRIFAY